MHRSSYIVRVGHDTIKNSKTNLINEEQSYRKVSATKITNNIERKIDMSKSAIAPLKKFFRTYQRAEQIVKKYIREL